MIIREVSILSAYLSFLPHKFYFFIFFLTMVVMMKNNDFHFLGIVIYHLYVVVLYIGTGQHAKDFIIRRPKIMAKTRSGAEPKKSKYQRFSQSTYDVKKYLQRKVDVIVKAMQSSGENIRPMKIHLFSTCLSKKFAPFTILLDPNAAENFEIPYRVEDIQDGEQIFYEGARRDSRRSEKAILKPEFEKFIEAFGYSEDDIQDLKNERVKRELGINNMKIKTMYDFAKPKFYTLKGVDDARLTRIVVLLDPIKVFHNMLEDPERPDEDFSVWISVGQKKNDNEFEYDIKKTRNKKGQTTNVDRQYEQSLSRIMLTSSTR